MEWPMNLLKQADFSSETDLKGRLYQKLFDDRTPSFSGRKTLSDEEAELVAAAGNSQAMPPDTLQNPSGKSL